MKTPFLWGGGGFPYFLFLETPFDLNKVALHESQTCVISLEIKHYISTFSYHGSCYFCDVISRIKENN